MRARLESLENSTVKAVARLQTRRGRTTQHRIVINGVREILRAAEGGVEFLELFRRDDLGDDNPTQQAWQAANACSPRTFTVTERVFRKMSYGERDEGILAVARRPCRPLSTWKVSGDALVLVLDQLEKPGNIGAIFRTADAVGVAGVIVLDGASDPYNPNAIRASLGTVFTTPALDSSGVEAIAWLRERSFRIVAARIDGAEQYHKVSYKNRTAITLGSESRGLNAIWRGEEITGVSLPMYGAADSLNVSVTAAVLCYEALRQRTAP